MAYQSEGAILPWLISTVRGQKLHLSDLHRRLPASQHSRIFTSLWSRRAAISISSSHYLSDCITELNRRHKRNEEFRPFEPKISNILSILVAFCAAGSECLTQQLEGWKDYMVRPVDSCGFGAGQNYRVSTGIPRTTKQDLLSRCAFKNNRDPKKPKKQKQAE